MVYTLRFFSSKCSLFHNSNVFGPCIIHVMYTGCAKIKKNSGAKRLMRSSRYICCPVPKFRVWPWYCYRSVLFINVKPVLLSTVWCCVCATTILLSHTRLSMILKQLQNWQFIDICFPVTIKSFTLVPMATNNNVTVLNCSYQPYDLLTAPIRYKN